MDNHEDTQMVEINKRQAEQIIRLTKELDEARNHKNTVAYELQLKIDQLLQEKRETQQRLKQLHDDMAAAGNGQAEEWECAHKHI